MSLYLRLLNAGYNVAAMLASPDQYPFPACGVEVEGRREGGATAVAAVGADIAAPDSLDSDQGGTQASKAAPEDLAMQRQQTGADLFALTADFLRNLLGFLQRGRQSEWEWADEMDMSDVTDQCSRSLLSSAALRLDLSESPAIPSSAVQEGQIQAGLSAAFSCAERALLLHAPAKHGHAGIRSALRLMLAASARSGSAEEEPLHLPPWYVSRMQCDVDGLAYT